MTDYLESDKYIVELDRKFAPDGTESLPLQEAIGGDYTTKQIVLNDLKTYLTADLDVGVKNVVHLRYDGNDNSDGTSYGFGVKSFERAIELATSIKEGGDNPVVAVYPGEYRTEAELEFPDDTTVFGLYGARKTRVIPESTSHENKNVFLLGNGGYVEGFSFQGFRIDDLDNPSKGFAIAFRPGAIIRRVPYAHNITTWRGQPPQLITAPLDRENGNPAVGNGGGVVIADGSVISQYSVFPNIMTWGATPSSPNGIGYCAKNGALLNPVNAIGIWCHKHFMCLGGGQMVLSACSSQFGDYSLWSEGFTYSTVIETIDESLAIEDDSLANTIVFYKNNMIQYMWDQMTTEGYTSTYSQYQKERAFGDAGLLLDAIVYCLQEARPGPLEDFVRGMFKWNSEPVYPASIHNSFIRSFEILRDRIDEYSTEASQVFVNALFDSLINTLNASQLPNRTNRRKERSLVTAINHQWTLPLSGVTRRAVPPRFGGGGRPSVIERSVIEKDSGKVRYSGQDDEGNVVFVGGLKIDSRSGELRGPPFDAAINKKASKVAIARSF